MNRLRFATPTLVVSLAAALAGACASDQKAPNQADVANGDALPAAPPVPAQPASTDTPATAPAPVVEQSGVNKTATPVAGVEQTSLTEAQIAQFADLANTSEVEWGKLAQTKAKASAVKQFATMMVKHHTEAQQEQAKLFKKLNLAPAESPASTELKADGDKITASLKEASAADFDRTYIASQVDAHEKVLKALDDKLLPAAHDQELTTGLRKMRATVEAHLTQAKTLQGQVK